VKKAIKKAAAKIPPPMKGPARERNGRFVRRYKVPRNRRGQHLKWFKFTKEQKAAYGRHEKKSKAAFAEKVQAVGKVKISRENLQFEEKKLFKLSLTVKSAERAVAIGKADVAAAQAAFNAAGKGARFQQLTAEASRSRASLQLALSTAQQKLHKAEAALVDARAAYKAQERKVNEARLAFKAAEAADSAAAMHIWENGLDDLLLNKVESDVAKLDRALFKKRLAKSAKPKPKRKPRRVAKKAPKYVKPRAHPKTKLKVVYEGVDNSIAAQQARKKALKAVQEDIEDFAINGSIAERHLREGHRVHAVVDKVREAFSDHQEELYHKRLIIMRDREVA